MARHGFPGPRSAVRDRRAGACACCLDTLSDIAASKKIGQRRIVIQHFLSVEAIRSCQILFVTRGVSPQEQRQAVEKLVNQPVLIVGESDGFAQRGHRQFLRRIEQDPFRNQPRGGPTATVKNQLQTLGSGQNRTIEGRCQSLTTSVTAHEALSRTIDQHQANAAGRVGRRSRPVAVVRGIRNE